jgi:intracellular septation protein A
MTAPHSNLAKAVAMLRRNGARIGLEIAVNIVLPFLIYSFAQASQGDVRALMLSSAPPVVWSIIEFIRERKLDALSILVLAGIVLSLFAYLGGGSARFLQLREKLVTGLIGLAFLGSAAIGRPLIYELARATSLRTSQAEADRLEALRDNAQFRRVMLLMTLVWGFGLVAECAVSSALVFMVPIKQFLLIGPVIGYGTLGALALWTVWYRARRLRLAAERQAAEAAAAAAAGQAQPPLPSGIGHDSAKGQDGRSSPAV